MDAGTNAGTIVGPAAWLSAACAPAGALAPRLQCRAADGRLASLVEVRHGAGLASHVLVSPAGGGSRQDVAVFEGRIEAMEWQAGDLLLAWTGSDAVRVFSLFPGIRLRDAAGNGGLRWVRLSTRRSRR